MILYKLDLIAEIFWFSRLCHRRARRSLAGQIRVSTTEIPEELIFYKYNKSAKFVNGAFMLISGSENAVIFWSCFVNERNGSCVTRNQIGDSAWAVSSKPIVVRDIISHYSTLISTSALIPQSRASGCSSNWMVTLKTTSPPMVPEMGAMAVTSPSNSWLSAST
jgi:hypothetical protein